MRIRNKWYPSDASSEVEHIDIPTDIKRCILHDHNLSCQSGSISCGGNVTNVRIAQQTDATLSFDIITPEIKGKNIQTWHLEKFFNNRRENMHLIAYCLHGPRQWVAPEKMEITQDMKECRFSNNRFICAATPEQHDLFWPEH